MNWNPLAITLHLKNWPGVAYCSLVTTYICCILIIHKEIYAEIMTNFNERTNTLLYKIIPLTLYSPKGDVSCVWEVSWRRGQTATYWPQVLLTIAALLSHSGWAAQPWVTEGPSPLSGAGSHSAGILLQLELELTQDVCGIWLYNCLTYTCFCLFPQVHLLIDGSVEGQYVTHIWFKETNNNNF